MTAGQAFQTAVQYHHAGRLAEAEALFEQVVAVLPGHAEALHHLGVIAIQKGRYDEAVAKLAETARLVPHVAMVHSNLGVALSNVGRFEAAAAACRRAVALEPGFASAHNSLGNALGEQGRTEEAIAEFREAVRLMPDLAAVHSNLLLGLHYPASFDPEAVAREHRKWDERHAGGLIAPHANDLNADRPLRIGYVSPDFWEHSVTYFLIGLLEAHDRAQFEVFCYSDSLREDEWTQRLREQAGHWRTTSDLTDEQMAALIREDRIDLLVDLAGHTAKNRLPVFARKPAPVQVSFLGYCNTTGLRAMDYRFTDAYADPPGTTEHLYTEALVRLPETAWCFTPPALGVAPASRTGGVTFGCFNARQKITAEMLSLWSRVLLAVPGSRLLLKNQGFGDPAVQAQTRALMGVASARVEFMGRLPSTAEHLAAYGRVDIALDTFPYHGTATSCEALWMGAPVVTLAGRAHVSRVGVSLLSSVGLTELIADTPERYVEIAANLARDPARLSEMRASLRARMEASPLMDAPRFARHVEEAYREMWRAWCARTCSTAHP